MRLPRGLGRKVALASIASILIYHQALNVAIENHGAFLRNSPTNLDPLLGCLNLNSSSPLRSMGGESHLDIETKYIFRHHLASGAQGAASVYFDTQTNREVVIKTFFRPGRNFLPEQLRNQLERGVTKWPTEIPISTYFGGYRPLDWPPSITKEAISAASDITFLPVLDFFLATNNVKGTGIRSTWKMVTPYVSGGTLQGLPRRIREENRQSSHELDLLLRPSFNNLLSSLAILHDSGFCHDDLKPANIFAPSSTRWLIGDLGNVREISHLYHATRAWRRRNQWHDCRANDIRRALKSYLYVIRKASADPREFDAEFYEESRAWSRLYWSFIRRPVSVRELLSMERNATTKIAPQVDGDISRIRTARANLALELAIDRELTCTSLYFSWRAWWYFGGFRPRYLLELNTVQKT